MKRKKRKLDRRSDYLKEKEKKRISRVDFDEMSIRDKIEFLKDLIEHVQDEADKSDIVTVIRELQEELALNRLEFTNKNPSRLSNYHKSGKVLTVYKWIHIISTPMGGQPRS